MTERIDGVGKERDSSHAVLDNPPPRQKPRHRRCECDSDGDPQRKQCLITQHSQGQGSAGGGCQLCRAIPLPRCLLLPITETAPALFSHETVGQHRSRSSLLGSLLARDSGEVELGEERLDVGVVLDGDVEAGDGDGGDGEVDAQGNLAVLLEQLLESPG